MTAQILHLAGCTDKMSICLLKHLVWRHAALQVNSAICVQIYKNTVVTNPREVNKRANR